jgi:hypothetical protein
VNARLRELLKYGLQIEHLYDGFYPNYRYKVHWRCHRQYIVRWVVSMSWIENLFTKAFWNGKYMTRGVHALIVPKRLGLRTQSSIWFDWVTVRGSTGYTDGMNARDPSMERDDDYQISEGIVRRDGHVAPGHQGESEDDYSEDEANEQNAQDGADENDTETGSGARVADEKDEEGEDVAGEKKTEAEQSARVSEQEKGEESEEVTRGRKLTRTSSF